jgi:hypothetical protein
MFANTTKCIELCPTLSCTLFEQPINIYLMRKDMESCFTKKKTKEKEPCGLEIKAQIPIYKYPE